MDGEGAASALPETADKLRDRRVCSPAQNSCRNDHICEVAADEIDDLKHDLQRLMTSLIKAEEAAHTARNDALEEAAQICEQNVQDFKSGGSFIMMKELPAYFRALKEQGT